MGDVRRLGSVRMAVGVGRRGAEAVTVPTAIAYDTWRVVCVAAGESHSAIVDAAARVLTFGHGEYGRLGHGDEEGCDVPRLVDCVEGAVGVACGYAHTVVVV